MTPRTLTVLTPIHAAGAAYFAEAAASVAALRLPDGWGLQWVVQEDDSDPLLAQTIREAGAEHDWNRLRGGASVTRNLGLLRARGDLVMLLDADDEFLPDAFVDLLPHLTSDRGWVSGAHVNKADGELWAGLGVHEARSWPVGSLLRHGTRELRFHPNNLLVRTDVLWRAGGWPGLAGMEDMLLLMRINAFASGAVTAIPTVYYRTHATQTVSQAAFLDRLADYHRFVGRYAEANA